MFTIITLLISLILNFIFFNYVDKLDIIKCKCSIDWKREFIRIYSVIIISVTTSFFFLDIKKMSKNYMFSHFLVLLFITGIFYLYTLYTYSSHLINKKCVCSDSWERKLMYNYSILIFIIYALIFFYNACQIVGNTYIRFDKITSD